MLGVCGNIIYQWEHKYAGICLELPSDNITDRHEKSGIDMSCADRIYNEGQ